MTRISKCQTFDEVLVISKEIHEYTKEVQEQMQKQANAEQKESEAQDNAKVESRPDMSESNDKTQAKKDEQETDAQGQGDQEQEEPVKGRSDKAFPDEVQDAQQEQDETQNSGDTQGGEFGDINTCLLYTSPSPRDPKISRMPSSA